MSKMKFVRARCEFRVHEDDWNQGEGDLMCVWNDDDHPHYNSLKELLDAVPYQSCAVCQNPGDEPWLCDPIEENNYDRFDADFTVNFKNEQICKPTPEEVREFMAGKLKLYALHVSLKVQKVCDLDRGDVDGRYFG